MPGERPLLVRLRTARRVVAPDQLQFNLLLTLNLCALVRCVWPGCWAWLLGLAAGPGCWAWLLGLAAAPGCWAWLRLAAPAPRPTAWILYWPARDPLSCLGRRVGPQFPVACGFLPGIAQRLAETDRSWLPVLPGRCYTALSRYSLSRLLKLYLDFLCSHIM